MPFALRFMIDRDIVGMGWLHVKKDSYDIKEPQTSRCQIEIQVKCEDIIGLPTDQYGKIAPIRILSFDIECSAEIGFPAANRDPIIQIASVV